MAATGRVRRSKIGYQRASGFVHHVDVRHVVPNAKGSSVRDPAIWIYERGG
jgi:hypothetical protein